MVTFPTKRREIMQKSNSTHFIIGVLSATLLCSLFLIVCQGQQLTAAKRDAMRYGAEVKKYQIYAEVVEEALSQFDEAATNALNEWNSRDNLMRFAALIDLRNSMRKVNALLAEIRCGDIRYDMIVFVCADCDMPRDSCDCVAKHLVEK
jgi:hypothetical protein